MYSTDDFIAHGLLPFMGREAEMEKILAFWQSVPEAQRLRIMLLTAEAGVGKSRLLEEALRAIRQERGAVVHVKLYPEATNSLAALAARSLWTSPAGRDILRTEPRENMGEVIAGLQRISRLRPTLLVLEDVHLFPSESIPDLVRLFEALVDETISVLCLSRPANIAAQGILERYLVDSITMKGLGRPALTALWNELFGSPPPKGAVDSLYRTTKGNPLAVRSGLRGAIQTGSIIRNSRSGAWEYAQTVALFEQSLQRSVSLVVEGMVAHLGRDHRRAAESLAMLGEVFARETVQELDPAMDAMLADLMKEGIIVETFHPVSPLCSMPLTETGKGWRVRFPASQYPLLAFTHSLLHDYLAERADVVVPAILRIVSQDAPLYSLLPLRALEKVAIPSDTDEELIVEVIRRIAAIAQMLDRTANWRDGAELLDTLDRLVGSLEGRDDVDSDTALRWRMHLHHVGLSILRRSMHSPEWIATHERQLEITQNPHTRLVAQYRVLAHSYSLDRIDYDKSYEEGLAAFADLEQVLEVYPDIAFDISYIYVLESLAQHAYSRGDLNTMRLVQERTVALLAQPDISEEARQTAIRRILPNMLKFFETPEELREREQSIELIEQYHSDSDPYYGTSKIQYYGLIGRFDEVLQLADLVMRRTWEQGLLMNFFVGQNWKILCGTGCGDYGLADAAAQTLALLNTLDNEDERRQFAVNAAASLIVSGFLVGDIEEGLRSAAELGVSEAEYTPTLQFVVDMWNGNVRSLSSADRHSSAHENRVYFGEAVISMWKRMAEAGIPRDGMFPDDILADLERLLRKPVLQIYDVLTAQGTVHAWRNVTDIPLPDSLRQSLADLVNESLVWLGDREIYGFMEPLCGLLEELGRKEEAAAWHGRIVRREPLVAMQTEEEEPEQSLRISMLGTIRVAVPPEDYAPIRGVRIRTLLGLMVADRMIAAPLSPEEFLALAGGEESDPEHARKKKNMAVVRLREIVGHETILTDGPTPQLNPDLVSVDLLEVDSLIRRAQEAVRQDALVRALPLIQEALNRYDGDVPFPTLYEDFFEAARGDFEYRLRQAVLETGRAMLAMGDAAGAEPFLRKAFELLPGDEDIAALLREVFESSGNRIEAERIRMKMEA